MEYLTHLKRYRQLLELHTQGMVKPGTSKRLLQTYMNSYATREGSWIPQLAHRSGSLTWIAEACADIAAYMDYFVRKVGQLFGSLNLEGASRKNRAYRALETVESAITSTLIGDIREQCGVVPMAYIYDGVLVHHCVQASEVMSAFDRTLAKLGLTGLILAKKPWDDELRAADSAIRQARD